MRLRTFVHSTCIFSFYNTYNTFMQLLIITFAQAGTSLYHYSCRFSEQNLHGVRAKIRTWACFIASQCATIGARQFELRNPYVCLFIFDPLISHFLSFHFSASIYPRFAKFEKYLGRKNVRKSSCFYIDFIFLDFLIPSPLLS